MKVPAFFSENPILVVGQNAGPVHRKVGTLEELNAVKIRAFLMPFGDVGHDSHLHIISRPT